MVDGQNVELGAESHDQTLAVVLADARRIESASRRFFADHPHLIKGACTRMRSVQAVAIAQDVAGPEIQLLDCQRHVLHNRPAENAQESWLQSWPLTFDWRYHRYDVEACSFIISTFRHLGAVRYPCEAVQADH